MKTYAPLALLALQCPALIRSFDFRKMEKVPTKVLQDVAQQGAGGAGGGEFWDASIAKFTSLSEGAHTREPERDMKKCPRKGWEWENLVDNLRVWQHAEKGKPRSPQRSSSSVSVVKATPGVTSGVVGSTSSP